MSRSAVYTIPNFMTSWQNQWYKIFSQGCMGWPWCRLFHVPVSLQFTNIDKIKKNHHFWTQIENSGLSVMEYTCKCLQAQSNAVKGSWKQR